MKYENFNPSSFQIRLIQFSQVIRLAKSWLLVE